MKMLVTTHSNVPFSTNGDDVLTIAASEVEDAIIDGRSGNDTLQLLGGGLFDFRYAALFTEIETISGSDGNDEIVLSDLQMAGLGQIDGGANAALTWDTIALYGATFDLSATALTNIDEISLRSDGAVLTVGTKAVARLVQGFASQNDRLVLGGGLAFTTAEIAALHARGIDTIVDANGSHTDAAPVIQGLAEGPFILKTGETVSLDPERNATIDEDGNLGNLSVLVSGGFATGDSIGLDMSGGLSLSDGLKVGSVVSVNGAGIGTIWTVGGPKLEIAFLNQNATPDAVKTILRGLTYTVSAAPPDETLHREVVIELSDVGNRISRKTIRLDQIVEKPAVQPAPSVISTGGAHKSVTGTDDDDLLIGGKGPDTLDGGGGDDRIWGKAGNDILRGGSGQDIFIFDTKPHKKINLDRIVDFSVADDTIHLDNAVFKTLGKGSRSEPVQLAKKMFWKGTKAHDFTDRLIYNPKTGALTYDIDGTGAKAAVKLATLSKGLKGLTHKDFFVI